MGIDIVGLGSLASAAKGIADKFWPDKTELEKATISLQLQELMNSYNLSKGQIDVNAVEAASTNWWVAGWRPFIGWICGTGFLYQFMFMPILNGILMAQFGIAPFVALDSSSLMSLTVGLLGLGGLRTFEKYSGSEAKR